MADKTQLIAEWMGIQHQQNELILSLFSSQRAIDAAREMKRDEELVELLKQADELNAKFNANQHDLNVLNGRIFGKG